MRWKRITQLLGMLLLSISLFVWVVLPMTAFEIEDASVTPFTEVAVAAGVNWPYHKINYFHALGQA